MHVATTRLPTSTPLSQSNPSSLIVQSLLKPGPCLNTHHFFRLIRFRQSKPPTQAEARQQAALGYPAYYLSTEDAPPRSSARRRLPATAPGRLGGGGSRAVPTISISSSGPGSQGAYVPGRSTARHGDHLPQTGAAPPDRRGACVRSDLLLHDARVVARGPRSMPSMSIDRSGLTAPISHPITPSHSGGRPSQAA